MSVVKFEAKLILIQALKTKNKDLQHLDDSDKDVALNSGY